jgi:NADH-quinone oxidoreductase subunit F
MDLHITGPEGSDEERAAVDAVLGPPRSGWTGGVRDVARDGRASYDGGHAARAGRDQLLPALLAVQNHIGWVSRGALNYISRRLSVPPAEAWGVASFYHLLRLEPEAPTVTHVCDDIVCRLHGAEQTCAELIATLGAPGTDRNGTTWRRSPCLGLCEQAPAALILRAGPSPSHQVLSPATLTTITSPPSTPPPLHPSTPQSGSPSLRLLRRVGTVDPTSLDAYRASGGFRALARARELGADATIAEVTASKLVGRGGAAFPTGRKWAAVASQPETTRYLVCNADESEPGTFKDRILMEGDPFAVLEGMAIAAFATGAQRGFLYIRGEYPDAAIAMQRAIDQATAAGLLAGCAMEIRRGGGAYICGEETALFNSIEGKRGEPRNKPPFPVQAGLFGKPTVVNNVETLANVPLILTEGATSFAAVGSGGSTGPKLFCVCGQVERPGLYEAPFGATLRDVLALAGGVRGGRPLRAVLLGGAAGTFVGPDKLDVPLTLEALRAIGASLGSGVIMAVDDQADFGDLLVRIAQFFRDESCGQCVPCRVGTVRQEELLHRLRSRKPHESVAAEHAMLRELGQAMRDASICGLGQTASLAIESALLDLHVPPEGAGS